MDCLASEGLYGGAEGAFGTAGGSGGGDDVGSCPAVSPGSPDECAGAVSTCWSPGQRDTDCPGNGLCCVSDMFTVSREVLIPCPLCCFIFFSLMVVQTPVMASLQVENIKKRLF